MAGSTKKVIYAAMLGNGLIAVTKFIAATFTGSTAMISEGIHSVVDTGNQMLLLYGMRQSKKPADEQFPFGHGKEVYFWSFVVAVLMFAIGAVVSINQGINRLSDTTELMNPYINYIVLALAMVFEGVAWYMAFKEFKRVKGQTMGYIEAVKRGKDPALFMVLFEDSAAMLGLIVAFFGVFLGHITGDPVFDGIASILIGVILGVTSAWLAYETKGLLIGESASKKVVQGIRALVSAQPGVVHVNEVLTMHMGPEYILVNLSVDFIDQASATELEDITANIDTKIKENFPYVKRVFIEAEPRSKRLAKKVFPGALNPMPNKRRKDGGRPAPKETKRIITDTP